MTEKSLLSMLVVTKTSSCKCFLTTWYEGILIRNFIKIRATNLAFNICIPELYSNHACSENQLSIADWLFFPFLNIVETAGQCGAGFIKVIDKELGLVKCSGNAVFLGFLLAMQAILFSLNLLLLYLLK